MTDAQLKKIKEFVTPYYAKTGKFHASDHIEKVEEWSEKLLKNNLELGADNKLVKAAVYIHDIGRTVHK